MFSLLCTDSQLSNSELAALQRPVPVFCSPLPLSPPLLSANSRRSLDCSHCSRRPCSTVPLNLVGSDLFWPLQCSGDLWTVRARPPAWRHTALFSSSLFSPLLLAIHLRCEIFFPSLNWDSSKRVSPINNDTMIRVISAKMAFIIQKLFPLLLSTSSLSTKVGETREERHVHLHSLAAFHSFMETHNKTYNNRWQSSHCPTRGWALQCHHCHCHCHRIISIVDQVRVQTSVPYLPEEHAESETAAGDGTGNNIF